MTDFPSAVSPSSKTLTLFGVLTIVLGVLAMLSPAITGVSTVIALGFFVTCAGVMRMFWAFHAGSFGKGLLMMGLGLLTVLCGLALFANPVYGLGVLTLVLAAYFFIDGVFEIAAGFHVPIAGAWLFVGGALSIVLGVIIWTQYPVSGLYAVGFLLGIKLLSIGMSMINVGSGRHVLA